MTGIDAEQHDAPRRRMSDGKLIALIAGAVVAVGAIITTVVIVNTVSNAGPDFEAAVDECGLNTGGDARVLDNGAGLILNTAGEDSPGLQLSSTLCILSALDVPDTTITRMEQTRSLDGRQSDDLGKYTVEWTYHPDDGLDVLFSK